MVLLAGLEELTKPEACSEKNATRRVLVSYWLLNLSCKPSSISDGPEQNHGCIPSPRFSWLADDLLLEEEMDVASLKEYVCMRAYDVVSTVCRWEKWSLVKAFLV